MLCFAVLTVDRIRAAVRWHETLPHAFPLTALCSLGGLSQRRRRQRGRFAWRTFDGGSGAGASAAGSVGHLAGPQPAWPVPWWDPTHSKIHYKNAASASVPRSMFPGSHWSINLFLNIKCLYGRKSLRFKHMQKKERKYRYSRLCLSFYQMFHFINKNNVQIKKQRCSDGQTVPTSATALCRQRNLTSRVCSCASTRKEYFWACMMIIKK